MRFFRVSFLALLISATTQPAVADPRSADAILGILNNYQSDLMQCSVFFQVSANCMKQPRFAETRANMQHNSEIALMYAYQTGLTFGMTQEAMQARMRLLTEDMGDPLRGNCANYGVLLERHLDRCVNLMADPSGQLERRMATQ